MGSDDKASEGVNGVRYEAEPVENHPSTSLDSWSENEDIDRAIALSLSEEDPRGNIVTDSKREDEQLGRAPQESLNAESPTAFRICAGCNKEIGHGRFLSCMSAVWHPDCFRCRGSCVRICAGCNKEIGHGSFRLGKSAVWHLDCFRCRGCRQPITDPVLTFYGSYLYHKTCYKESCGRICDGCNKEIGHGGFRLGTSAIWHPDCFRCRGCRQPITDCEFSTYESYPYHKACWKEAYLPKCYVCNDFIPSVDLGGQIIVAHHPFWSQKYKYCPSHAHDGTPRCCSCIRMESRLDDARFAELNDGRKLCLECLDSAIMDTDECQPLFIDILDFFEGLNMKVTQQVPLLLVERQALNEAMDGERHGHHHMPETRGRCLSEEQTVSSVRPFRYRFSFPACFCRPWKMCMRTEPRKLIRHCQVRAILVLYGLPRLLTGSILAHEMMHAWLRLNGFRALRKDVEEGICNVMSIMWLESQIMYIPDSDKKLGEFLKHQIATQPCAVYGDGFRAGNQAVHKFGLQRTLDHIRETGNFPSS